MIASSAQALAVLIADGTGFVTRPVPELMLTLEGIAGDRHTGFTRKAGGREPWYPRGTPIRNDRQVSIVCPRELALVASRMAIAAVAPEWIGANLVVEGLESLTALPRGTRLVLPSGAALVVNGANAPCRHAGAEIARRENARTMPEREGLDLLFPKVARGLRGVIAAVERAGQVAAGDTISVVLPKG